MEKINKQEHALEYCTIIKDRPEVRKYIKTSKFIYKYCRNFNIDNPEMAKKISSPMYMRKYILDKFSKYQVKSITGVFTYLINGVEEEHEITFTIPPNLIRNEINK